MHERNKQIEGRPQQQFVLNKLSVARICSAIGGAALVLAVLLLMGQHEVTFPVILSMISASTVVHENRLILPRKIFNH